MTHRSQRIRIDGSYGEGGGQILRTSMSLAALLGVELEIVHIRAGRKKPGLMAQHLTGVQATAEITDGELEGAELGSQTVRFRPGEIQGGSYLFDVSEVRASAGSTGMIFQSIAPVLAFAGERSEVVLKGGTHTNWAPPIDYLREVFLPMVRGMNLNLTIETEHWGWYPEGRGVVRVTVAPTSSLKGIDMTDRRDLIGIEGRSVLSNLPISIAERQRDRTLKRLEAEGLGARIDVAEVPSVGRGTFLFLLIRYAGGVSGFSALGARRKRAERVADEAVVPFLDHHRSGAAVDPHLADQLILYMALAGGRSTLEVSRISQHLLTNIWVIAQFLPVRFEVEGCLDEPGHVAVDGIEHRRR